MRRFPVPMAFTHLLLKLRHPSESWGFVRLRARAYPPEIPAFAGMTIKRSGGFARRYADPIAAFRGGIGIALALFLSSPLLADSLMPAAKYANEQLPDRAQEAKAKALMETIRCLVCQGQSIADSEAEMAGDMRALIRTRIAAGEKPEAIRKWLIERYGDWVSYTPPLDALTWPLYALPVIFLAFGLWIVSGRLKRRRKS